MDENEKALQRFAAINYINELHAQGFSLERCYRLASEKSWGGKFYSARTFERWCTAYKQSGFNGLQVKGRNDRGQARALDEELMEDCLAA